MVLFSTCIGMGIMTSYGSYNEFRWPVFGNAVKIAIADTAFSFMAGLAIFCVIGYLKGINSPVQDVYGFGLAYIAYPIVLEVFDWPRLLSFLVFFNFFIMGFDSGLCEAEAILTMITDLPRVNITYRKFWALGLCILCILLSLLFCSNWGYTHLWIVNGYVLLYVLPFVALLQCAAATWFFKFTWASE